MRNLTLLILFILLVVIKPAESSWYNPERFDLSFGTLSENLNSVQTDDSGSVPAISSYNPYFGVRATLDLLDGYETPFEIGYVLRQELEDTRITKDQFFFRWGISNAFNKIDWLKWHIATTSHFTYISGDGGSETLGNGSGEAEYYVPSESKTLLIQSYDLGLEADFEFISLNTFIQFIEPIDADERSYNLSFSVLYNFLPPKKVKR